MKKLNLKPTHKPIRDYYEALEQYEQHNITHEGAVSSPFAFLLATCAKKVGVTLEPQHAMRSPKGNRIVIDGAIIDPYRLPIAYWEAKDMDDDLPKAIQEKRDKGYPFDNILFQNPERAILYQNDEIALDTNITDPENLIEVLQRLFSYSGITFSDWYDAVDKFSTRIPALADELKTLVEQEHKTNGGFKEAFAGFYQTCRTAINPDLSQAAVEEMLIQHILTERIFLKVFDRSDFTNRNIIAIEIEKVSKALMQHSMSRDEFLKPLEPFYTAIEDAATYCKDFSEKQHFLNTVYERFFQGFSVKVADTHGIVYTPQPIVDFMVNSVEYLLKTEFNRSLSDTGVHIIDPFVGTGNFIVRLMQDIQKIALENKYRHELHCNEVLLLPYYVANLNIEQEFWQRTQKYLPFEGIVFADTFELFEKAQQEMITPKNTERVNKQKATDMFVVIGNPPYNAGQQNENDNNKNRKYPAIDKRIKDTYSKDSKAQLHNKLYDPFVRAFSWASERIRDTGIVAFVTNNSFIDAGMFDGMRKHLAKEFDALYLLNLGGNLRKGQPAHSNVFNIRVGVSIAILVRTGEPIDSTHIFYNDEAELQSKAQTFDFLKTHKNVGTVTWQEIQPNVNHTWLTGGIQDDFDDLVPIGTKEAKKEKGVVNGVIFKDFSLGVSTNRDVWVYNFDQDALRDNVQRTIKTYTAEMDRWNRQVIESKRGNVPELEVDDFVLYDDAKIKWSSSLKSKLESGKTTHFSAKRVREALYRPFTKLHLYFDPRMTTERASRFPRIFPTPATETENQVICVAGIGDRKGFGCLATDKISALDLAFEKAQCFPFYTYDEDGTNLRENITDWALLEFRRHYGDESISKWDIFYYTYGILHQPDYRDKYQESLKRSFPRILFANDFWAFSKAGKQLAYLHINYESAPKYTGLTLKETPDMPLNWRVEKMTLSKDKTQIRYNDFLTIENIPVEAHDYRLGTRSALEWIVDQYSVTEDYKPKTGRGSRIVNDPNRETEDRYIVDLIARVITVSLETINIINNFPTLRL
ncbi:N-6 DNA methylase [Candidatus Poribacteria bacterium]|nr:N-6 DNA methylase [Candidatus Poribacteria bacterium]MYK24415.1 N-6 DNA methylase [Candidatus Poribacteria bacterium]